MGYLRFIFRAAFSLLCILFITLLMSATWSLGARRTSRAIMRMAFRAGAYVWGIRIRIRGEPCTARPLLIVSNHFSYVDLFVLGSVIPAAFTPKSEVRSWPLLGFMAKVSGCLFIDRRAAQTLKNKKLLEEALTAGDVISLFPEGTTSDGTGLLPFKSAFFSLAQETGIPVQPVSIVYTRLNDRPVDAASLPVIGWYGDSLFFPHMAKFLQQKNLDAALVFHPPLFARDFASRKELASECRSIIEKGMREVLEA